ncbi:acetyltransferase [Thiocystis violacea]|uniref:acetyltransferase n=1 Tax=Thiocystis violacea TaxID=13725 RepID=UPI001908E88D|nr:acetyltransferase [Thiocystis violacea]MBK1724231.1 acetyltransferase [Thiocystis violacea]
MFIQHRENGKLIEVLALTDLINPLHAEVIGRFHQGEEAQEPESFPKTALVFPSGEPLPRCWTDVHYCDEEIARG